MTFKDEFEHQWTRLSSFLEAEMIRCVHCLKPIEFETLETLLLNEKKRWHAAGQYQNAWFNKLSSKSPQTAQRFSKALDALCFERIKSSSMPSSAPMAGAVAGGAALGFGLMQLFAETNPMAKVVGSIVMGVGGAYAGNEFVARKKRSVINGDKRKYMRQLRDMGATLSIIAAEADA